MSSTEEIALFPLNTLFVPEMTLPLQIFEQRYLNLIKDCLKNGSSFGVVSIRDGKEVGTAAMIYNFGVIANIVDWSQGENGLLHIKVLGSRKFRVLKTWVEDSQLMRAQVEYLPSEEIIAIDDQYDGLRAIYDSLATHPQIQLLKLPEIQTINHLGWFLTLLLPISRAEQIELIKLESPVERLERLSKQIDHLSRH